MSQAESALHKANARDFTMIIQLPPPPPPPTTLARLLSRAKINGGLGTHYGLELRYADWSADVLHLDEYGVHVDSYDDFAAGRAVTVESYVDHPAYLAAIEQRFWHIANQHVQWRLLDRNCEHIARWVLTGEAASNQIAWGLGITAALVLVAATAGGRRAR